MKCVKPFGLVSKKAIHGVTLLENNPLLSASRALWLAFLLASAAAKQMSTEPKTTYVSTYLGNRFYPLEPRIDRVAIEDIAHGLAFQCRFNGQTCDFYSVAQHSLIVADLVPEPYRLAALLHDAPEYVIGDMISPVKAAIGPGYGELDSRLTAAVHLRFGLPAVLPAAIKKEIKRADRLSAWLEAVQIAGFAAAEADRLFGVPDSRILTGLEIRLRPPVEVRAAFAARHRFLTDAMAAD